MADPHGKFGVPHGPWTITRQTEVYRDPWVGLRRDEVIRPDGEPGTYCVVDVKPGVCVLAIDEFGDAHLTEEFHYGVGRVTLEAVSGGIERDEEPIKCAERELREELGILAGTWELLTVVDPLTANVVSPTHLYLAKDLVLGDAQQEGGEVIRHVRISFDDVIQKVMVGEITHAPSCVAILMAAIRHRQMG